MRRTSSDIRHFHGAHRLNYGKINSHFPPLALNCTDNIVDNAIKRNTRISNPIHQTYE